MHVLQHHDGVLAGVAQEEVAEVGGADGEDQLVRGEVVLAAGERDVDELLLEKRKTRRVVKLFKVQ